MKAYIFCRVYLNILIFGFILIPPEVFPSFVAHSEPQAVRRVGANDGSTSLTSPGEPNEPPRFVRRNLSFQPNTARLIPAARKILLLQAGWLREHRRVRIMVVGFCDPLGSEVCSHRLAQQRAELIQINLLKSGVDSSQIVAVKGWDDAGPICQALTEQCQQENRRVRIFLREVVREDER